VSRRSSAGQLAALLISLAVLWYVDWRIPSINLGPIAALPLLVVAYRSGARLAIGVAAVAAIAFAVADAGIGSKDTMLDLTVDSLTLFAGFGAVALLADRARDQARQMEMLRKRYEREKRRAEQDAVTNLPNRSSFDRRMTEALTRARRSRRTLGILVVDIDRFKEINDRYGHPVGDAVLQQVASRLSQGVRDTDVVARIGGDEFAVIVQPIRAAEDLIELRDRLLASVAAPVRAGDLALDVCISAGYSLFPDDGDEFSTLIQTADRRMYESKPSGRQSQRARAKAYRLTS
jgi:diguanylate cyclase (GGDEF)-like protein